MRRSFNTIRFLPKLLASTKSHARTKLACRSYLTSPNALCMSRCTAVHYSSIRMLSTHQSFTVDVPSMGDSISEGTIVQWIKSPGDFVEEDEVIVVLETDKVSVDVRSPSSGILEEHLAAVDDTVSVGAAIAKIRVGEAQEVPDVQQINVEDSTLNSTPEVNGNDIPSAVNVVVPSMGDSISEGTVVQWVKGVGEFTDADEVVVVLETDKVSVDVRAPQAGKISKTFANIEDIVEIGNPLFELIPGEVQSEKNIENPSTPVLSSNETFPKNTPEVTPTTQQVQASTPHIDGAPPLSYGPNRGVRREKMSRMRQRIAERLKESQNVTASLTTFQECDMGNLMAMRKEYKEAFEEKHGVKLGFMSAFVKASAASLLDVPAVNAMIDDDTQEIVFKEYVDMSVAVSTPKGLVTPVLTNTESMSFVDVEKKLIELAKRARDGELTLEEMSGGNFTISNGGVFGSLMGTPIINRPQSSILGMHGVKMRPVLYKGEIVPRPMMYLALTYDHRLIDGREAVTCLKSIADKIENPERLLLDL